VGRAQDFFKRKGAPDFPGERRGVMSGIRLETEGNFAKKIVSMARGERGVKKSGCRGRTMAVGLERGAPFGGKEGGFCA